MKKIKILLIIAIVSFANFGFAQTSVSPDHYSVYFTDKNNSPYSVDNPLEFLSQKALDRRAKYGIEIKERDLPVNPQYLKELTDAGFEIVNTSKWLNCAVVKTEDPQILSALDNMEFVIKTEKEASLEKDKAKNKKIKQPKVNKKKHQEKMKYVYDYGEGTNQITMLNGHKLHSKGFRGEGVTIAVMDAGFYKVNKLPSFDSLWANNQILGWYDFVDNDTSLFKSDTHGMMVLSCIGANIPGEFVGTAPEADFWLLRTENASSEYIIEEYNWVFGAEFADSVGADIVHSSLGYSDFDNDDQDHKYSDMDGNTTVCTRGADFAAATGMLVSTSAGNEGNDPWRYISAPADADSVLSVGAVNYKGGYAYFSSQGPTYDGRIKPDVCAQGLSSTVQGRSGRISVASGTSFSGPIMAGMVACLWQAHPEKTNMEIIHTLQRCGHKASDPDEKFGYGIPDFFMAHLYLSGVGLNDLSPQNRIKIFPNPFEDEFYIGFYSEKENMPFDYNISVYDNLGKIVTTKNYENRSNEYNIFDMPELNGLQTGIYHVRVDANNESYTQKVVKR